MITHLLAAVLAGGLAVGDSSKSVVTDATIAAAARDMRIQIYDTFREDRAEYDRRQAAWQQVNKAWLAAGSPAGDREKLIHWLAEAESRSVSSSAGLMPEAPKFTPVPIAEKNSETVEWLKGLAEEVGADKSGSAPDKKSDKVTDSVTQENAAPNAPALVPALEKDHRSTPHVNLTAFVRNLLSKSGK